MRGQLAQQDRQVEQVLPELRVPGLQVLLVQQELLVQRAQQVVRVQQVKQVRQAKLELRAIPDRQDKLDQLALQDQPDKPVVLAKQDLRVIQALPDLRVQLEELVPQVQQALQVPLDRLEV